MKRERLNKVKINTSMGTLSRPCRDRCYGVTYTTIGCVVFLSKYFQSLILQQLFDKLQLS